MLPSAGRKLKVYSSLKWTGTVYAETYKKTILGLTYENVPNSQKTKNVAMFSVPRCCSQVYDKIVNYECTNAI